MVYRKQYGEEGTPKPRVVLDYRPLNSLTPADCYPLPDIPAILEWFAKHHWIGSVDCKSGYWQVELEKGSMAKTAFIYPGGFWEYTRVPFGLKNAPPHFMRCIHEMLAREGVVDTQAFVDDLMTGGTTFEHYLEATDILLRALRKNRWLISANKAKFAYTRLKVLGHEVEFGKVRPDGTKVEALRRLLPPQTVKQLRAFLGLVGFYRRFIPGFARISKPMTALLKEDQDWVWGQPQQAAFEAMQQVLTEETWLGVPQEEGRYKVYTDFSCEAMGAALHQVQGGEEVPIAFASRVCRGPEVHLDSPSGELAAAIFALHKFREYVGFAEFDLITDSTTVKALQSNNKLSGKLARWAIFLSEFRFVIHHKAGATLHNADGLSRARQLPNSAEED